MRTHQHLSGKTVLITGAARGLGAQTARLAAAAGAKVALLGLEPQRLQALAQELGSDHAWFECDVTDQASLERAVAGTVKALGGIDFVVANAGIANNGTVAVNSADALARTIEVNLIGVVRTVSATLPHVTERRGYYLLVSSAAALRAMPGMAAYSASKVGVEYFGDALRLEVKHKGVDVGVVHPCWIDTDLVRDAKKDLPSFDKMLKKAPYPFGSYTSVEVCAEAFVDALNRRRRKIYVPKALAPFAALRWFFSGALSDRILAGRAATEVPELEAEVLKLGRAFGSASAALTPLSEERASSKTG